MTILPPDWNRVSRRFPWIAIWQTAIRSAMGECQAAIAIRNARLYNQIEQAAVTDELTGLSNRRGFFKLGEREFERATRFSRPLAAVMFDIDRFKRINDTYGHITVSIGVAELSTDVSRLAVLLERADHALYHAKNAGRNRVVTWEQTPDL
jgi:PleD family two-component response regulator